MQFIKNRTVIGVICIVLSLVICFAVTPLFNQSISEKTEIVRVVKPVKTGEEITADKVKTVEVGGYNLPDDVVKNLDTAIGKFASADLAPGDYIIASKIADEPAAENAYLYSLTGEKQAISVSVKAFANGLSGKLQSGDIVSVIAPDYKKQGATVIPAELQYMEVIAVTANSGYDANTGEQGDEDAEKGTSRYGYPAGSSGTGQGSRGAGSGRQAASGSCLSRRSGQCRRVYHGAGICAVGTVSACRGRNG